MHYVKTLFEEKGIGVVYVYCNMRRVSAVHNSHTHIHHIHGTSLNMSLCHYIQFQDINDVALLRSHMKIVLSCLCDKDFPRFSNVASETRPIMGRILGRTK